MLHKKLNNAANAALLLLLFSLHGCGSGTGDPDQREAEEKGVVSENTPAPDESDLDEGEVIPEPIEPDEGEVIPEPVDPDDQAKSFSWGGSVAISNASFDSENAHIAIDGEGNAVAVWVEHRANSELYSSYLDKETDSWTQPVQIGTALGDTLIYQWNYKHYSRVNPQVSINNGVAFAVWIQNDASRDSVYVAVRENSSWSTPHELPVELGYEASHARIATDKAGRSTIVWREYSAKGRDKLFSSTYTPEQKTWSNAKAIADQGYRIHGKQTQLAIAANDTPTLLWSSYDSESGSSVIQYSEQTTSGWTTPTALASGSLTSAKIAFHSSWNSPVFAWTTNNDGKSVLQVARKVETGWDVQVISDKNAFSVDIAEFPDGKFIAVWASSTSMNPPYYAQDLVSRFYTGSEWQSKVLVSDSGGVMPRISSDGKSNAIVVSSRRYAYRFSLENGWKTEYAINLISSEEPKIDMNSDGMISASYRSLDKVYLKSFR